MFHWICPECGREIAPTVRECPVCDPVAATVETALAGEVEAPARAGLEASGAAISVTAPAAETKPEPRPYQPIRPVVAEATMVAEAAAPVVTAPDDSTTHDSTTHDSVAHDNVAHDNVAHDSAPPALAERVESVSPLAARSSRSVANQDAREDALPQFGSSPASGDPFAHLSSMVDAMREPNPPEPPSHESLPIPIGAASNVPASLRAFIAELRPAGAEPRVPLAPERRRQAAPEPPLFSKTIPLPLGPSRQAHEPPLGAKLLALPLPAVEAVRPSTPAWEPAPPLAPLGNYSPLEGRPLRPAIPKVLLLKKDCGPRTTLPGPMLTRRLVKFTDRGLRPIPPAFLVPKKRMIPGWMVTALILGTLLGAGFTSVISVVRPTTEAKPAVTAPPNPAIATAPVAPTQEVASVSASPLVKAIEVTGFRIQMDPAKKSEIQYLVVNHTAARFSGVTVYVTLYTADAKAGQPPLCRFQFTAPNLAPFQAKDMTSAIERVTRPVSLPEWQDLRATVEIGE
jgi:hypothetical protein